MHKIFFFPAKKGEEQNGKANKAYKIGDKKVHVMEEQLPIWDGGITKITHTQLSLPVAGMTSKK